MGAHAKGFNAHSIGICYEGGLDEHGRCKDSAQPLPIGASGKGIDVTKVTLLPWKPHCLAGKVWFKVRFNIIKYKYVKEFRFCVIFLVKKFVLSMIIRIFPL